MTTNDVFKDTYYYDVDVFMGPTHQYDYSRNASII